jgi:hypothetical protein
MKKKPQEYKITYQFVDCPDAEERTQKIYEFLLKANMNKLKKSKKNTALSGSNANKGEMKR